MEEEFPGGGGEIFGKFYACGTCQNSNAIFLTSLIFSLPTQFLLVKMLRVIVRDKFSPGLNCPEYLPVGWGIFTWRWNQISWHR